MALVGNKADLQDLQERQEVYVEDGTKYAEKNGMIFIETSAQRADDVNQLFDLRKSQNESLDLLLLPRDQDVSCKLSGTVIVLLYIYQIGC